MTLCGLNKNSHLQLAGDYARLTLVLFRRGALESSVEQNGRLGRAFEKSRQKEAALGRTRALCKLNGAKAGF